MNRIYRVIWNCTLQVFQACSELTRRAGKTSTVNLRKSSGLTTKFSRLTLGVLLALSGSASGASLEVDNDQITNTALGCTRPGIRTMRIRPALMLTAGRCITGLITASVPITVLLTTMILAV